MIKVVRLTESDLTRMVRRVLLETEKEVEEQKGIGTKIRKGIENVVQSNPVLIAQKLMDETKPSPGGKYCFTKEQYIDQIRGREIKSADAAREHIFLYRIQQGDTPGEFKRSAGYNKLCKYDAKNFRKGDVIMRSKLNELT